jgi:hypothetical protein
LTNSAASTLVGNGTTEGFDGVITLLNQMNTSFWGRVTWEAYYINNAVTPLGTFIAGGGSKESAQDTDAVRFLFSSGNIAEGNYAVYGLS